MNDDTAEPADWAVMQNNLVVKAALTRRAADALRDRLQREAGVLCVEYRVTRTTIDCERTGAGKRSGVE